MLSSPERMGAVVSGGDRVVAAFEATDTLPDAAATARLDGFRRGREEGLAVGRSIGTEQVTTSAGGLLDGLRTAVRRVEAANGAAEERVGGAEPAVALVALIFAYLRAAWVRRQDEGNERMRTDVLACTSQVILLPLLGTGRIHI